MNWNYAPIMNVVWDIDGKKDILWVRWIHARYIKECDFWTYKPKQDSCHYWKEMMRVKEKFADMPTQYPYTISKGYDWLQGAREKPKWRDWVWNKFTPPKIRFIISLFWRGRLQTNMNINTNCELCECAVSISLFEAVMNALDLRYNIGSDEEFRRAIQGMAGGEAHVKVDSNLGYLRLPGVEMEERENPPEKE
ncbi:unnamed protein product [Cuscuta campestris]|uniref:Reverse transcriptase zinc-binding domain-containing protein n=1 Tax=Cuscuta campestris TaxID=132261 RepID=A0A484LNY7_9ASTE|nr:unnamed protein product [Cuscuta campestris]